METYFSRWEGVWYHGDWAKVDEKGLWYLYGRSDDTIKVSGKRVGPNEIESELIKHPGVIEAAVVGTPHPGEGRRLDLLRRHARLLSRRAMSCEKNSRIRRSNTSARA